MSKLKTSYHAKELSGWGEKLGSIRVLSQDEDLNYNVEIDVMRSGTNQNNWNYRNVDKYAKTFAGQPILTAYIGSKIGDGHNMSEKKNASTGETYFSFTDPYAERIVGMISEDEDDIRTEQRENETWIIAKGKLWRFYNRELVDKIASQGGMKVSAETDIKTEREDGKITIFEDWRGIGVTLLGDDVAPAIPGANIHTLAEIREEFNAVKLKAASLHKQSQNTHSKGVKTNMNKKGLADKQKLFPNHKVLGISESGLHVCLMSNDGRVFAYTFENDESTVDVERIENVSVNAAVNFGEEQVEFDASTVYDAASARVSATTAALNAANQELEKANATIETMRANEAKRRIAAVKSAVKAKFNEINAVRADEEKMDEHICDEIIEAADKGTYSECEAEDGEWCGEAKACEAVMAKCMAKILEMDSKKKKTVEHAFCWENFKGNSTETEPSIIDKFIK